MANPEDDRLTRNERIGLYRYLVPLIAGPLLILAAAFLVLPSEWFARRSHDPWLSGIGYGASLHGADCQVLIYGDSTAEVGINPDIIQRRTGLSTCNIAQIEGLIVLSGHFVLDRYLEHNVHPQVLVVMFAPEDFNPESASREHAIFEAITFQMGQSDKRATLASLATRPEDLFRWAYKGIHMALRALPENPTPLQSQHVRERTLGQLPINDPMMGSNCSDSVRNLPPDKKWVSDLRSRYSRFAEKLIIDVMPIPACDPGSNVLHQQFAGVVDNSVEQLPSRFYYRGGRHVNSDGSAVLSNMLADQIESELKTNLTAGLK